MNNGYCKKCNVTICDDSVSCPLCKRALYFENVDALENVDLLEYESKSIMYPDIEPATRRMKFIIRLFVFVSIIAECIMILVNYLTYSGVKWSLIGGAALVYMCFTLAYTCQHNTGHRRKILAQAIGAMILEVLIDYFLGYNGWSVNFAIPSSIVLIDIAILVLMVVNFSSWQSYIMIQIVMLIISLLVLILIPLNIITFPMTAIGAAVFSGFIVLGVVLLGDKKAINELNRRFRV